MNKDEWQPIDTHPDPDKEAFLITDGRRVSIGIYMWDSNKNDVGWFIHRSFKSKKT